MDIIVVSIHITAAVILVLTVLLQAGKGSGMGAAFGGSSGTVFGARGPATLISKITCAAAVIFMITSLNLALSQSSALKKNSIMDEWSSVPAASAPAASPASPAPVANPEPVVEEAAPAASLEAVEEVPSEDPVLIIDDSSLFENPVTVPEPDSGETAPAAVESGGEARE